MHMHGLASANGLWGVDSWTHDMMLSARKRAPGPCFRTRCKHAQRSACIVQPKHCFTALVSCTPAAPEPPPGRLAPDSAAARWCLLTQPSSMPGSTVRRPSHASVPTVPICLAEPQPPSNNASMQSLNKPVVQQAAPWASPRCIGASLPTLLSGLCIHATPKLHNERGL